MGGFKFNAFVMYVVLLVAFLSLISMVFDLHRFALMGAFLILLLLMLLGLVAAFGIAANMRWSWVLLTWLIGFIIADMVLVNALATQWNKYFLYFAAIAAAGFFISLFSIPKEEEGTEIEVKEVKKAEEKKAEAKIEAEKKTTIFKPGKYVVSMTGSKFHIPRCDWAKKIKKANAVWFNSKEEAVNAGYKADYCVK